jgi:tungstate transport system substrate-binding protein
VAVGTGQALDIGRRGDADVVFVHDRPAEEKFMDEGFGVRRFDVMYNDFVVIGPLADPAHIDHGADVIEAFRKIAAAKEPFISRGDRSGQAFVDWLVSAEGQRTIAQYEIDVQQLFFPNAEASRQ